MINPPSQGPVVPRLLDRKISAGARTPAVFLLLLTPENISHLLQTPENISHLL
jgi:hypothetical protein